MAHAPSRYDVPSADNGSGLSSVSYTHLDVYKRQIVGCALRGLFFMVQRKMDNNFITNVRSILPSIDTINIDNSVKSDSIYSPVEAHRHGAVSYTHLDVYKRQLIQRHQ